MRANMLKLCEEFDMTMPEMLGYLAGFIDAHGLTDELKKSLVRADSARKLCLTLASEKRKNLRLIRK